MGANNGDSLPVIGALLGHRNTKTTQRYAHLADHPVRSAAERIATRIADYLDVTPSTEAQAPDHGEALIADFASIEVHSDPILGRAIRTQWLDTRAAAAFLGKTVGTLQTYRWMGTGPEFTKVGRRVVYSAQVLGAWKRAGDVANLDKTVRLVA
jgi:hypothetical protein